MLQLTGLRGSLAESEPVYAIALEHGRGVHARVGGERIDRLGQALSLACVQLSV